MGVGENPILIYQDACLGKSCLSQITPSSSLAAFCNCSGAGVMLLGPYDEGVFYGTQVMDDIRIVSPVQIYLDLKSYKGRGEEAAEVLLREIVKPKWTGEKQ